MPEEGEYILRHIGFSKAEKPILSFQHGEIITDFSPYSQTLTLQFNMDTRFCTGWHDLKTGKDHVCPNSNVIDGKYNQCAACQKRTGFNPAFYNAASVSAQQEERNLEPHTVYLAYFAPNVIKVGISHSARGTARLLEQGARSAIILETFPSAHIARQYEAKIAALPYIVETVQIRKKITVLQEPYDEVMVAAALTRAKKQIEIDITKTFDNSYPLSLDHQFFPDGLPSIKDSFEITNPPVLSGKVVGMLGSLLFCTQQDAVFFMPLKKYVGYKLLFSHDEVPMSLPIRQTSLF
jgi:hypothetical protein